MTIKKGDRVRWIPRQGARAYGLTQQQFEEEKARLGKVLEILNGCATLRLDGSPTPTDDCLRECDTEDLEVVTDETT